MRLLSALLLLDACLCNAANSSNAAFGIEKRIPFTSSRLRGSPDPPLPYRAFRAFPKLEFKHPLHLAHQPGTDRLLLVEQNERILAFTNKSDVSSTEVFCFIREHEIYALTFHPGYASNRFVYVFANGPHPSPSKTNKIFRYVVDRTSNTCHAASQHLIIDWESNGHNGGDLAFGPDGMLYLSAGDGTSDSDKNLTGQDITDLPSAILRIDVDRPGPGRGYSIPRDNPFLEIPGARGELWAYGFRNPWRIHFDTAGNLWVGDIGQDLWEMIIIAQRGANYGWSVTEGGHAFQLNRTRGPTPISPPTIEHSHSEARSITGGVVYRGKRFPDLRGAYIYGDYGTGRIWGARYRDGVIHWNELIADTPYQILGFGEDAHGEIYFVDYGDGGVYGIEASPPPASATAGFPQRLGQTGLFRSLDQHQPHAGLIPYAVNAPYWADGAHVERFIALPGASQIEFHERDGWKFPEGTVLVQTLALEMERGNPKSQRRLETRVLLFEQNEWAGYTYQWNDEQTDAVLLGSGGDEREFEIKDPRAPGGIAVQAWHYPSRTECLTCHSRAAGFVLGLNTAQINREHSFGGAAGSQLRTLEHLGVFKVNLHEHARELQRRFPALDRDQSRPLEIDEKLALELSRFTNVADHQFTKNLTNATAAEIRPWWTKLVRHLRERPQFTTKLPKLPADYSRLANPYDASADLTTRARAYLHVNCSHCHTEAGGGNSAMELRITGRLEDMRIVDVPPQHDTFDLPDARIIAAGDPERSTMLWRLSHRGYGQMPPLATMTIDEHAVQLFRDWIQSLNPRKTP